VFRCSNGQWCARRADGLVCGLFIDEISATSFAKREGQGVLPTIVIELAPIDPLSLLAA